MAKRHVSELRDDPLTVYARVKDVGDQLSFETLHVQSATAVLTMQGQVLPTLDAQANVDAPRLADAWPGLLGSLHARLSARGPLRAPHVTADARIEALSYSGLKLRHAQLNTADTSRGPPDEIGRSADWARRVQAG